MKTAHLWALSSSGQRAVGAFLRIRFRGVREARDSSCCEASFGDVGTPGEGLARHVTSFLPKESFDKVIAVVSLCAVLAGGCEKLL